MYVYPHPRETDGQSGLLTARGLADELGQALEEAMAGTSSTGPWPVVYAGQGHARCGATGGVARCTRRGTLSEMMAMPMAVWMVGLVDACLNRTLCGIQGEVAAPSSALLRWISEGRGSGADHAPHSSHSRHGR